MRYAEQNVEWREARSQGGRRKWEIRRVWGVCEKEILGLGGFKKKWQGDLSFSYNASCFSHNVWNGFGNAKWFRRPLRFSHIVRNGVWCAKFFACFAKISQSVQNDFAGLVYFCKVCKIGLQGVRNFAPPAKWAINFAGFANCLDFSSVWNPSTIYHQKPKLNQTKIKLKRRIENKTSNNTGKLSNKK